MEGHFVYFATWQCWQIIAFRSEISNLPDGSSEEGLYFATLEEARRFVGNLDNEERGVAPLPYDKSKYTDGQETHYCLCCGYRTISGTETPYGFMGPPGTFDICPICFWEDDSVGVDYPDVAVGPNAVSLKQAQRNFMAFGAMEQRFLASVRKPTDQDERDPNWKPL